MVESMGSFKLINESTTDTTTSKYIVQPVEKRIKNPSSIWKYYGIAAKETESSSDSQITNNISKNKNGPDDRFLCLLCFQKEKVQLYKKSTSSGNLWRHLNRMHRITIPKCINTAVNVRSELINPISEEVETVQHNDESNLNINNDLKFSTNDSIDSFKDIGSLLIEEISKYHFLYENTGCGLTDKHDKVWNEIYESLGKILDIKRLQEMWKNIRDRYIKIRNCEKNESSDSSIKYKYYNQLKFLDNELFNDDFESEHDHFLDSMSMDEPLEKKPRIDDIGLEIDIDKDIEEYIITETSPQHLNNETNDDSLQRICITSINKYDLNSSNNYSTRSFDHNDIQDNNFKILTSTIPCLESEETSFNTVNIKRTDNCENINIQHENNNKTDELDLFGRFVAEKMRSMPKSKWDNLQIKILQLLRNEQN